MGLERLLCKCVNMQGFQSHETILTGWQGDSEVIIGKWLALNPEKRKDVFIATKFGGVRLPEGFGFRGDAEYVSVACEQSLQRLGVETVDLWYPHRLDGSTPVEHIVAEMVKLKE